MAFKDLYEHAKKQEAQGNHSGKSSAQIAVDAWIRRGQNLLGPGELTWESADKLAVQAKNEYEDFRNSEEYAAMLDRRGMAQLPGNELFSMLTGYSRQEDDRLRLREESLRRNAEDLRSLADQLKNRDIYENAETLAEQAEAELEEYLHSEEYAAWSIARDKKRADAAAMSEITGNPAFFPSVWDKNEKEQELRANAEYYRQVVTAKQEQAMMDKDLQELSGWSKEEQDALKVYALGNYQNAMASPEQPTAMSGMNTIGIGLSQKLSNAADKTAERLLSAGLEADPFSAWANAFAMPNADAAGSIVHGADRIIQKYGEQRVREIAESYMRSQSQEAREMVATAAQEGAGSGFWAGAGHSLASVGANLAGSLTAPLGYLAEATGRTGRYSTLDPNNPGQIPGVYAGAVRQEVAGNIQDAGFGKAGATVYQAGMSALDNLARMVAGGGVGSLALAATGSFGQAVSQYSAQGATPVEAVAMGIINGGLEVLTEKISLDNILDEMATPKTGMQMLKAALRAGGIEVTEEEMSFLGSTLAEAAVLREKSGYQQQVAMLKAFGLSDAAARAQASRGVIDEAWQTAVQSFLSGGMMSGATSLYGKAVDKVQQKQLKGTIQEAQQKILNREDTGNGAVTVREGSAVAEDVRAQAQRIASVTGRQIELYDTDSGEDGYYDKATGILHINARGKDPFAQIVSHELTHSVEMSAAYKEISSLVMNRIRQQGGNLDQLRQEKRQLYAKNGVRLQDDAEVDSEIVATYIARHLLTNEQEITSLARENPTLAQKVRDWLDGLFAKLGSSKAQERTFVKKARDAYARALEQTGGRTDTGTDSSQEDGGWDWAKMKSWADQQLRNGDWTEEDYDSFMDQYDQYMGQTGVDTMAKEDHRFRDREKEEKKFSFAGENSKTADRESLERARGMEAQGANKEAIRQETGWFRGMEGKSRYEIDDSKMKVNGNLSNYMRLGNLITHDELFAAYPDMADMDVVFQSLEPGVNASYNPQFDSININRSIMNDPEEIRRSLIHEIQHAIQNREGFTPGGNAKAWERKIQKGFDSRRADVREKERKATQELNRIREEQPEFYRDMMELEGMLPDIPRGEVNWDTLEQIEEDPPEWKAFDARREELEERYGEEAVWDFDSLHYDLQQAAKNRGRTGAELYYDTAGEIEARNVAGRRNMTAEERKKTPPQLGDENTVFADQTGISFDQAISEYPYNMQTVIRDYVDAVDEDTLAFIEDVQSGKAWQGKKVTVGLASTKMVEDIARLTGVENKTGCKILLNTNAVRHIQNRHGESGEHDDTMRDNRDIARMDYVLQNYDEMTRGKKKNAEFKNRDGSRSETVVLSKKINGTYFVVEAVPDTGKIAIVSAYMNKNGASQVPDGDAPSRDVRNELASTPTDIVSDGGVGVNRKDSGREGNILGNETGAKENGAMPFKTGALEEGKPSGDAPYASSVTENQSGVKRNGKAGKQFAISESAQDTQHKPINREELPVKARKYLESAERGLLNHIGKALGVPYHAKRDTLKPMIQQLSDEYLSTGTISQESMDRLFEEAYQAGVVIDREFYDQYKHVKDHLRETAVTIRQQDQADIADFQDFRRRSFGTLRITKEGGIPVDSYYRELQEMAPELFPDHITHPADQLQRMLEVGQSIRVTEGSLDSYYGKYAQEYKAWQKNDFIAAIHDDLAELRTVQRYAQEKNQFEREGDEISVEEAAECWAQLKAARRNYEKVNAKNLLSLHDEMQVGRLLRGEILLEHLEGEENFKGIKAIYEAKQEYEKIAKQIGRYKHQVRRKRLDRADELLKTANEWKDKKTGIQYSRETMRRNILDIVPDQAVAAEVLKEYFEPVQHAEALSTKFKTEYRDKVRALNLNTKVTEGNEVSEAYAVQLLGEAMDNIRVMENARGRIRTRDGRTLTEWRALVQDMWEHSPNLDRAKIEGAVKEFRKIYDELFQKMNQVRMENGYEPVNYRQGYFPHFQPSSDGDGIIAHFGKVLGIDTNVDALPTTINGLTHTFKPGIQWFGNAQQRLGFKTAYDAVEGFDKYIEGVSSVIHHTENIQKLRALATQARYRTSDEGIREQVDAVQRDTRLTDEERQLKIREIYEKGKFALSNFVAELDEYTNLLANKKSRFDRTMESFMGRRAYTIMKNVESRVAANMIAGNISSAVTNFIPLTQAMGRIGSTELLRGMKDARRAIIGGTSDFVGMSDFLTNRRGSDVLVKGWSDKLSGKLGLPMEMIDNFTSEAIVRAAYYQNIKRGMSESEAIHDADILAASIMADRSKGSMPTLFESRNPLFKALTQFQLEVNNQYSEIFKDMPREYAEQAKWVLALGFMKYFIAAFLFNELEEKLKGRRSALDPIGIARDFVEDWRTNGFGDAGANLTVNLLEGMPFSSALNLLGIDIDGGRVAVASAIPDIPALWQALTDRDMSGAERWDTAVDELQKPIIYLALPVGGNQLSKTWKGVAAYIKGGSYGLNGDGEEILQYPVYKDEGGDAFWNLVKSMVFGKNSLGTAQAWVNSGFSSLNAKQTAVYQDMLEAGGTDREAYELIDAIRREPKPNTVDGWDVQRANRLQKIQNSELSDDCKDIAYYGLVASDSERKLMDTLTDAGAGSGIGEFVAAYADAKQLDALNRRTAVRDVLLESALTEQEKQVVIQDLIGPDEVTEKGTLTQYGKYLYALEQGLSTDDFMELYAKNVYVDDYLDLLDVGISSDGAMDLAVRLGELDTTNLTSGQKWTMECDAIMAAGLSEKDQVAALVSVSYESTGRMVQVGYDHGIDPSVVLDFKRALPDFDANSNRSYSQKEVTSAIDAIAGNEVYLALTGGKVNLTNTQKAVLWQLQNSSWKPNKNPYDKDVGQYIYDLVKQMKEEK